MKYRKELFYSVRNGGDGSAYPRLMESAELASYDQESDEEGWGEDCSGSFIVESDSPINVVSPITTIVETLVRKLDDDATDIDNFVKQFYPNGLPTFSVKIEDDAPKKNKYAYFRVYVGDEYVAKIFREKNTPISEIENKMNSYGTL